jgi:hypothetical protein
MLKQHNASNPMEIIKTNEHGRFCEEERERECGRKKVMCDAIVGLKHAA